MLLRLRIQNYAIIDELAVNFGGGFNIITGETGAGKSILTGALDLILGKRADSAVLKDKNKKCFAEAVFSVKGNKELTQYFSDYDLDIEDEILIRREITSAGKSRGFVNDTPVNLSQLKELGNLLVDMHRQFDTLELGTENFQRKVLDALANNHSLLAELKSIFAEYQLRKKELDSLKDKQAASDKEFDYNSFLAEELANLGLRENELEDLDAELRLLSNAENVKMQLSAVYEPLINTEQPVSQVIKMLAQKLRSLLDYHPALAEIEKRLLSAQIEIQDAAAELEAIGEGIHYDEKRIDEVNARISSGYKLLKKHGVTSTAELRSVQSLLEAKLQTSLGVSQAIEKLEKEIVLQFTHASGIAAKISRSRAAQTTDFAERVNALLLRIGMPNARLKVEINPAQLTATGADEIHFLFDANTSGKGSRFEPLQKVASGGELSRLMLSIKSLVAKKLELPVLIFDEIDTGISGEAARQVGVIMKELASCHQVIAITHQPQIAAKASSHYFVYKAVVNDAVQTSVKLLTHEESMVAVAKMLSGEKPTSAALANAREMMN